MSSQVPGTFKALLEEVTRLRVYGASALYRRIRSLVAEFARAEAENSLESVDLDPRRRPCNEIPPGPLDKPWKSLTFDEVALEVQLEDARRTVFLDPKEAAIAALATFLSGQLQNLEFRDPEGGVPLNELEEIARKTLVGKVPIISINPHMASSMQEVVHSLRYLADSLESSTGADILARTYQFSGNAVSLEGTCSFERKEQIGSRWTKNGTVLEYHFRDIYKCLTRDPCCGNPSYHYEYQNDRWEVVWQGSENPGNVPPVNPPNYESSPWRNRLPLFTDSSLGTQTSDYGWRTIDGTPKFHAGIDIAAPASSNVQSNIEGTVAWINQSGSAEEPQSRGVIIRDNNNITYTFWHVTPSATLKVGDSISKGDRIGGLYDWGTRTHLHYAEHAPPEGKWEQRNNSNSRDPLP
ncbi:M23 family metallopeptidase [Citrobacter sp. A316]|uniref:M23 family metallopeptidase n=2 Tax=Citrobacter freundii complex TaxID=1344959 RepID=UPI0009AE7C61|nr:M23 family metallopeptidase [Citrobacter sp. A316]OPW97677.1 hypothetical protein BZK41_09120 [Citrobacter sp. A316]